MSERIHNFILQFRMEIECQQRDAVSTLIRFAWHSRERIEFENANHTVYGRI